MAIKENHWIVSFIDVGQYKLSSWQSIFLLSEGLDTSASIFFSYAAALILSFHSWSNVGWLISFIRVTTYALNILIIISFLSFYSVWIYEEFKLLFDTKFLSVFDVEVIVLIHVMNLFELSVSSALFLCFISFGSFAKLLTLHSKIVNPFEKCYSDILLGRFNMTTEFMFFKKSMTRH